MVEQNKDNRDPQFLRNMERFLALGNERGIHTFVLEGSVNTPTDQVWWVGFYPHAYYGAFPGIGAGIFGNCTFSLPKVRELIEKARIPEKVEENDITISSDDHNYTPNQEELSNDMPTIAILRCESSENGQGFTILRAVSLTPNDALEQIRHAFEVSIVQLN